jgi:hypothetical protein
MSNEDIILNVYALTNEGMTGNLAILTYGRALLDLHKCTYLGTIVNTTSVGIYEIKNAHVFADFDIVEGLLVVIDGEGFHGGLRITDYGLQHDFPALFFDGNLGCFENFDGIQT